MTTIADMTTAAAPDWTGIDLRLLRVARRLTVTAVAAAAERSRQTITGIECQDRPTPRAVAMYLDALARADDKRRHDMARRPAVANEWP